ncbi:SRPBCC domain-containing protein [uncultured Sunxiuqinia sp.]|uniref:SRPBCC family protein n=1 Tax=uncultured Sunxiuqinia sp. TaxID=1573825 RepID=UPI0030DC5331|tara:strand:+ start:3054 stop:3491 length:438 start_codon:yes stop_codon:yes gene_type:complete
MMESKNKLKPVVKEVVLNAPIVKVWRAITNKNDMKQWYFELETFRPEVGFEFQFYGGKDEKQYLHLCQVTEVIPGRKLAYSWRYDGNPGNSSVTFELFPEGKNTKLRLTHQGLESFGTNNPDLAKENFVEGWNTIIGKSIKAFVE